MPRALIDEEIGPATGGVGGAGTGEEAALPLDTAQLGLWALLGTLAMLFAGFTSAYLVRRAGTDWDAIAMPGVLWGNTALLVASSFTLEAARAAGKRACAGALRRWLGLTTGLGFAFGAGQLLAWQQLAAQGVYVRTSPHSSFFYMLTAVHGAHLVGGLAALLYALSRLGRARGLTCLELCAPYWHFVGGVWLYLMALLFIW